MACGRGRARSPDRARCGSPPGARGGCARSAPARSCSPAPGLLDGRRATTHWAACAALARNYPRSSVETDPIFVRDGRVVHVGGSHGRDRPRARAGRGGPRAPSRARRRPFARAVPRAARRSGAVQRRARRPGGAAPGLRDMQEWIADHLDSDLSVAGARRARFMSPRNFARAFRQEVGVTPAAYVEALRVERARTLLRDDRSAATRRSPPVAASGPSRRCAATFGRQVCG